MKKKLVVSAVNLTEGGTLTVLRECLNIAVSELAQQWDIVALVHNRELLDIPGITYLEFPQAKRSWLKRLYYELYGFKKISRELRADLWLSLHDITPNVSARRQAVYCHNPSPFYSLNLREALIDPTFFVFNCLYGFVYSLNIQKNDHVIVQQKWLRSEFERRYRAKSVIVAHPVAPSATPLAKRAASQVKVFFFPALARFFKNFEVICAAVELMEARSKRGFEVRLTIDGTENRYASDIVRRYGKLGAVRFIGRQTKEQMDAQYQQADCLLFPSRLETWGLPVTEAKQLRLPMLVADLPYAHETVGTYDKVRFFQPSDAFALAELMEQFIENTIHFESVTEPDPADPFAKDWTSLLRILTVGL